MRYTYIASDNTASNGTALGDDNVDVVVYKILYGNPADGKITTLYDKVNPVNGSTTNVVFKHTQPTAAAGKDWNRETDFGPEGVRLGEGGNVITDGSQVTVVWDLADR